MKHLCFFLFLIAEIAAYGHAATGSCGGILNQTEGEFFSPGYPSNYPVNASCTWNLLAGEKQMVWVNFTFVMLELGFDFVRVYDGPTAKAPLLGSLTGTRIASFYSRSRNMTVVFNSDYSINEQGFGVEWKFYVKRQELVRLQVTSDGSVFDPAVQLSILNQLSQKLKENGTWAVKWRVQPDGNIFYKDDL